MYSFNLKSIRQFFTVERIFILLFLLVLIWAFFMYTDTKLSFLDNMDTGTPTQPTLHDTSAQNIPDAMPAMTPSTGYLGQQPITNPSDLLPADTNSEWTNRNGGFLAGNGNIATPDLLDAGYHIGLDTIGQSLRNPNLQIRSDPIIQKQQVGPWNQSTIDPDLGRVPLELYGNGR